MFHRFRSTDDPNGPQGALTPEQLESIIRLIGVDRILSPHEWLQRVREHRLDARDVCLTFDDGLQSQHRYALPVLDGFGLKAFWFVYSCVFEGVPARSEVYSHVAGHFGGMSKLIDAFLTRCPRDRKQQLQSPSFRRYADTMRVHAPFYSLADVQYRFLRNQPENTEWFEALMNALLDERGINVASAATDIWLANTDLADLTRNGHSIGLHSYHHPFAIGSLSRDQQADQYRRNLEHIVSATGIRPRAASHPLNSYNRDTLEVLSELGIECAFRANMVPVAGNGTNPNPYEFAREDAANLLQMYRTPLRPSSPPPSSPPPGDPA